jgi:hypothetical protein
MGSLFFLSPKAERIGAKFTGHGTPPEQSCSTTSKGLQHDRKRSTTRYFGPVEFERKVGLDLPYVQGTGRSLHASSPSTRSDTFRDALSEN